MSGGRSRSLPEYSVLVQRTVLFWERVAVQAKTPEDAADLAEEKGRVLRLVELPGARGRGACREGRRGTRRSCVRALRPASASRRPGYHEAPKSQA